MKLRLTEILAQKIITYSMHLLKGYGFIVIIVDHKNTKHITTASNIPHPLQNALYEKMLSNAPKFVNIVKPQKEPNPSEN